MKRIEPCGRDSRPARNQSRHHPSQCRWDTIQRGAMIEGRADFAKQGFNDLQRGADGGWWRTWLGWRLAIINETPTFAVFVVGTGTVPFDPATNRVLCASRTLAE